MFNNGEMEGVEDYWNDVVKVFSNEFLYEDEKAIGFMRPIIHTLNKQEFVYGRGHKFKKNVIVMGDIVEDS